MSWRLFALQPRTGPFLDALTWMRAINFLDKSFAKLEKQFPKPLALRKSRPWTNLHGHHWKGRRESQAIRKANPRRSRRERIRKCAMIFCVKKWIRESKAIRQRYVFNIF
jgi:hypothetical protein